MNRDITHIDLYSILGVTNDATKNEIKKKYRELSKKHHPDKGGNSKIFEMITRSYNVLSDDKQRADYDMKCNEILEKRREISFLNLKTKFNKLMQDMQVEDDPDKEAKFERMCKELDQKHNFKRDDFTPLGIEQMAKRIGELQLSREQDDIEIDEPLFTGNNFTNDKFNAAFDALEKQKDIIEYKEPIAWNADATQCALFDPSTYNNVYAEDNFIGDDKCSSIKELASTVTIKKNINVEQLEPTEYYKQHNSIDENYEKKLQERMKERNQFDNAMKHL